MNVALETIRYSRSLPIQSLSDIYMAVAEINLLPANYDSGTGGGLGGGSGGGSNGGSLCGSTNPTTNAVFTDSVTLEDKTEILRHRLLF